MRRPAAPAARAARKSGTSTGALVASAVSTPQIAVAARATSSTVRARGPTWSSEEAKATTP